MSSSDERKDPQPDDEEKGVIHDDNGVEGNNGVGITTICRNDATGVIVPFVSSPDDSEVVRTVHDNNGVEVACFLLHTPSIAAFKDAFKDHFTLPIPSSIVCYRESHSAAQVIEGRTASLFSRRPMTRKRTNTIF
jgi:hypothetical protein